MARRPNRSSENAIAASAQLADSAGTLVASGLTVGLAGTDIVISQAVINLGDNVSLLAGTITGV
jgi:hypothetical protein